MIDIDRKGFDSELFFSILLPEFSELLSPFLDAGRCNNKKDAELLVAFGSHLGYTENQ